MADDDLLLVFTNPTDGREAEFNEWYDTTHVRDVLAVPGVVAARRYAVSEVDTAETEGMPSPPPPAHRYLAIYRLDRDANEVMHEFVARLTSGAMALSDCLDFASVGLSAWSPLGSERAADRREGSTS
jgi:hypothetical protein